MDVDLLKKINYLKTCRPTRTHYSDSKPTSLCTFSNIGHGLQKKHTHATGFKIGSLFFAMGLIEHIVNHIN
jgi:hypothetical protein